MPRCGRRLKTCRRCKRRFKKSEYDLWNCPKCGEDRKCTRPIKDVRQGCRAHGGASPKGIASPSFKHGGYSDYMPTGLAERYAAFVRDPDLLELSAEIAVARSRVADLLERIGLQDTPAKFDELRDRWELLVEARRDGDAILVVRLIEDIGAILAGAFDDRELWTEVGQAAELLRRLTETERRRQIEQGFWMSVEEADAFLTYVTEAIKRRAQALPTEHRRAFLADISADLSRIYLPAGGGESSAA